MVEVGHCPAPCPNDGYRCALYDSFAKIVYLYKKLALRYRPFRTYLCAVSVLNWIPPRGFSFPSTVYTYSLTICLA